MTTSERPVRPAAGSGIVTTDAAPAPLVLAPGSWQWRLVQRAERLHALGKPAILLVKLGDCPPNFWKYSQDGSA